MPGEQKGTFCLRLQEGEGERLGGGRIKAQSVLPEPLFISQMLPGHEDALLRRGTVPLLRHDSCRFGRMSHRRILQQREEY